MDSDEVINEHWTKESLGDLEGDELAELAIRFGIDSDDYPDWDAVEDALLAIQNVQDLDPGETLGPA